ncbi:LysR family transcriptional regulator [Microbaculum marinisediminis]|uniref:LysR family transcriptional regulator n=1 Tax=Microbaculum marinisediminis TaxID=2931392 RepID=A0AAW5QTL5_9HYPH|nr:LysR family transcriptional regulator [Microbaculum sp. A6E488]MCT8971381.1 LysR family transcriptional regulator [Microbaculum sp. A6E488]
MSLSVQHMRWVVAAADFGGFSRAARHLGISQPSLSAVIQATEEKFGARLFDRTTRYIGPTAFGDLIVSRMRAVIAEYDAMLKDIEAFRDSRLGNLEIACLSSLAISVVPHAVRRLKERYPSIRLVINEANSGGVAQQVREGTVDMGICADTLAYDDLLFTPLAVERLGVFYSRIHFPEIRRLTWRKALTLPRIAMTERTGIPSLLDKHLPKYPDTIPPVVEVTNLATMHTMVRDGIGIGILPSFALRVDDGDGLAVQYLEDPVIDRRIGAVSRRGRTRSPSAQVFADILHGLLKETQPAFDPPGPGQRVAMLRAGD